MTTTETRIKPVVEDLYRNIHKGIRGELFAVTSQTGQIDPACAADRTATASHVRSIMQTLVEHAEHEDTAIQPVLERELSLLAEQVAEEHEFLEHRIAWIANLADAAAAAGPADARFAVHELYLELASFTSAYLAHQDLEERVVMPALEQLVGVDAVVGIHLAIIGAIPPEGMARTLPIMLLAMNVDDRTELLGGMQAGAPPEVFAGVWSLAGSVLADGDRVAVARRLGLA